MKNHFKYYILSIVFVSIFFSCEKKMGVTRTDTRTSGEAIIVVDETLMPIVNEQIDVFEGLYPEASIDALYTSELDAYQLFVSDSIHYLVGTRPLTSEETKKLENVKRQVATRKLAVDGVALIMNKENRQKLFTLDQISDIVTGKITKWSELDPTSNLGDIQVVFDRPNSSTARFIEDSIAKSQKFSENVSAIVNDFEKVDSLLDDASNRKVIDYVIGNKNALGILGVNWISEPRDTTGLTFDTRIEVASINNPNVGDGTKYFKPYAGYLGLRHYPLSRDVYVLKSDMYIKGIYSGLSDFMLGEKGQRMINKCGLFPANVPTRLIEVSTSMSDLE